MFFIFTPGEQCKAARTQDGAEVVSGGSCRGPSKSSSSGYWGLLQGRNKELEMRSSWRIVLKDKRLIPGQLRNTVAQGSEKSFWSLDRSSHPCPTTLGWPQWSIGLLIFSQASLLQYLLLKSCRQATAEEHNAAVSGKSNPAGFTGVHPSALHWFSEMSPSHTRGEVEHGATLSNI